MTGGGQDLQVDLTERDVLAIGQSANGVVGLGRLAEPDPRPGCIDQLEVSGDEVGVEVGVDHSFDRQPVLGGVGEVLGDVAARVDNDCAAGGFVADQVRRVGQALDVVLLEDHRYSLISSLGLTPILHIPLWVCQVPYGVYLFPSCTYPHGYMYYVGENHTP